MNADEMEATARALVAPGKGILAADESLPTIEQRFKATGLASTEENRRSYREMLFTTPGLGEYISGVILFDETMRQNLVLHAADCSSAVPTDLKRLLVTALEISPEQHLQIQAAFQRYVDNSVSKTINLPGDATREDIAHAYQRAWELGLKGITIYRYGSKSSQVLELGAEEKPLHYDHASRCDPEECRV